MIIYKNDILYENIDFLTLRVSRLNNPLFITCIGLVDNSPEIRLEYGFKLVLHDVIRNGKLKILQIRDSLNNDIGQVRIKLVPDPKDFINHDELEFTSNFFTFYSEYIDYFLSIFNINRTRNSVISRIDYAIDILNYSVEDIKKERIIIGQKQFPVVIDNQWTYFRYQNQRHKLVFYNKRLDTIDKNKHKIKIMNGTYPYKKYIENITEIGYITRIEYRKNSQSFRDIENSSINWIFNNIRSLAIQYTKNYITIDITQKTIPYNQNIKIKKDVIYSKEVDRKSSLSLSRMDSYMNSYTDLNSESRLFNHLSQKYGYRLYKYLKRDFLNDDLIEKSSYNHLTDSQ